MTSIAERLSGGLRKSLGDAATVAEEVTGNRALLNETIECVVHHDPIVRSRAAYILARVAECKPEWIQPFKVRLLYGIAFSQQWEVREQICKIIPKLSLTPDDIAAAVALFREYLDGKSVFVKAHALQALVDLTAAAPELQPEIRAIVEIASERGSAAVRARARKLLKYLSR